MEKNMLGRKKAVQQEDWLRAWREANALAKTTSGKERAEKLLHTAATRIPDGRIVCAWSGGKDALAMQAVCDYAGVDNYIQGTVGARYDWTRATEYYERNRPNGCFVHDISELVADAAVSKPQRFMPETYKDAYFWYRHFNQATFRKAFELGFDYVLTGHRIKDGNNCFGGGRDGRVYPIYDYSHEDTMLLVAYAGYSLPEIYFYEDGFHNGSDPWCLSKYEDWRRRLRYVQDVDNDAVERCLHIPKVSEYLSEEK